MVKNIYQQWFHLFSGLFTVKKRIHVTVVGYQCDWYCTLQHNSVGVGDDFVQLSVYLLFSCTVPLFRVVLHTILLCKSHRDKQHYLQCSRIIV